MNGIFLGIVASSGNSGGALYAALNGYYLPTASLDTWCDSSATTVYVAIGTATSIDDAKDNNIKIFSNSTLTTKALIGYYGNSNSPSATGSLWEPEGNGGVGKWTVNNTQSCTPQQYVEIPAYFAFSSPNYCVPGPSGLSVYVTSSAGVTTILDARNGGIPIFSDSGFVSSASAGYYGDNISTGYEWNGTAWGINVANCP